MTRKLQPTAVVTGAGTGLGSSLAFRLAQKGYAVAVHYRKSQQGANRTVAKILRLGGIAFAVRADLSTQAGGRTLAREIKKTWGRLDVLINNAGMYSSHDLVKLSEEEWFEGINSTCSATFFATRELLPLLRKSKIGRVVNIGDSSCERPTARDLGVSYHIGKTGVLILTRSFARAEAKNGITVNMVSPGWLENSQDLPDTRTLPMKRYGTFVDVFNAVDFFLKPESDYVTGSNLIVSGGWNLR